MLQNKARVIIVIGFVMLSGACFNKAYISYKCISTK
jgi:hypothetical protein